MDYPKRTKSHKTESDSVAILMYKLRDLGIFRSFTERDYGIDLEIELVDGENVIGKFFKAQIKGKSSLSSSNPTISGISKSTLLYWIELSFQTHVIGFAIDISNENIFVTKPLFWKSLSLLNSINDTVSINFISGLNSKSKLVEFIKKCVNGPSIQEQIIAHKSLLISLNSIIECYITAATVDIGSEIITGTRPFELFINSAKVLVQNEVSATQNVVDSLKNHFEKTSSEHYIVPREIRKNDIKEVFNFDHYANLSYHPHPDINAKDALIAFALLIPKTFKMLKELRKIVLSSKKYWENKDINYLKLVFKTKLPESYDFDTIVDFYDEENKVEKDFDTFLNNEN